jgi:hypothetical protein
MAINKNHEFEELNGVKCGIVERNVSESRAAFLKELLECNHYTVVIVPSALPKAAPAPPDAIAEVPTPSLPATFTVGVTDVSFNPVNAIFGRLLKTRDGHVVTLAYWQQKEEVSEEGKPYFQ